MSATVLDARDLRVGLDSETGLVKAIDGINLAIERGETFALVGESGCGKSMTALALLRLLPDNGRVRTGRVNFSSTDATGKTDQALDLLGIPESAMRRFRGGSMGIIFQEPATSLNPVMRVGDQIIESIEAHTPLRGPAARAKALQWLQKVGIPEPERRIDSYPFQMSGGQKQRVMIAVALAAEPQLLIADEPTTALDVTIQAQILELLKTLQKDLGMGLLLITHDLAVVKQMADRVALMYAGQIIETASAADFFTSPRHPYAQALLQALPDATKRGQALAAIGGTVPPLTQDFSACRFAPRCAHANDHCLSQAPELESKNGHGVRCFRADEGIQFATNIIATNPLNTLATPQNSVQNQLAAPLLQVRDLHIEFAQKTGWLQRKSEGFKAVDGIGFEVKPGQTVALVGESGCGKTTTGKALMRLLDRVARVSGQVSLSGIDLLQANAAQVLQARQRMQIIFQDPFASLNPRMRVGDILGEGMLALRPQWSADEREARITSLIERVGLRPDARTRWPHEFSGGQRQRIAIARALAVEPQLIICDEPTSALDVSVQAQILNLLAQLQRELGVAYLFITHNFAVVEYFADHICVMSQGKIVEQGHASTVLAAPQHTYTQKLLAAVPRV